MIFATSISPDPSALNRQLEAVNSWQKYNLHIFSINSKHDIKLLEDDFHNVIFIESDRNAHDIYRKDYIYAYDLIKIAFKNCVDESIFVINSDIELNNDSINFHKIPKYKNELEWFEYLSFNSLICFKRFDFFNNDLSRWDSGNDGFIINRKFLPILKDCGFVVGQCFWDWWIPMSFFKANKTTWTFNKLFLIHHLHPRNHNQLNWDYNFQLFKDEFLEFLTDETKLSFIFESILMRDTRTCNNFDIIL